MEQLASFKGLVPGANDAGNAIAAFVTSALGGDQKDGSTASKLVSQLTKQATNLATGTHRKGVELVDGQTGLTLGHISRARALRMLTRRRGMKYGRRATVVVVPEGHRVEKVKG